MNVGIITHLALYRAGPHGACHATRRITVTNPRFLSETALYDVASTMIHLPVIA